MQDLVELSKAGDENAFTKLIVSIENDLYRVAKTRLDDDYDIRDAIQETMILTYSHLKNLKDNSKFKSWIMKILINECNKIYKKKKYRKNINNIELYSSDKSIDHYEEKYDFSILIDCLNYEEKLIVTLFYNNKYTCNEISKILNKNQNTVRSKLTRAKEKIKKNYKGGNLYE